MGSCSDRRFLPARQRSGEPANQGAALVCVERQRRDDFDRLRVDAGEVPQATGDLLLHFALGDVLREVDMGRHVDNAHDRPHILGQQTIATEKLS